MGDLYFEFKQPFYVDVGKMKKALPENYNSTNFTSAVSRMFTTGYMEKIIKNAEPYFRLTGIGEKALRREFPIFSLRNRKWDKKWRIVFYDVPEKEKKTRRQIQEKLQELGFGMIQESVYISPFDVAEDLREFMIAEGLGRLVFVCVANQLFAGDEKLLAEKIWNLENLNKAYAKILEKIKEGERSNQLFSKYEDLVRIDPCLPKELLPNDWVGDKVYKEIKKLLEK